VFGKPVESGLEVVDFGAEDAVEKRVEWAE
jgi:hypothetical protein